MVQISPGHSDEETKITQIVVVIYRVTYYGHSRPLFGLFSLLTNDAILQQIN